MRIFNLTENDLDYRGKVIRANGGFQDYPALTQLPNRDLSLVQKGKISIDVLPKGWRPSRPLIKPISAPSFHRIWAAEEVVLPEPAPAPEQAEEVQAEPRRRRRLP